MLGGWEWIAIVAVLFMLFGASRLPQLAKSLGQSRKAFREGMKEAEEELAAEEPKQINSPNVNNLSDEELAEEMRRRTESKQA